LKAGKAGLKASEVGLKAPEHHLQATPGPKIKTQTAHLEYGEDDGDGQGNSKNAVSGEHALFMKKKEMEKDDLIEEDDLDTAFEKY
jgi:hypothetical protein